MKEKKNKNNLFSRHIHENIILESPHAENIREIIRRMKAAALMPVIDPVIDRKLEQISRL